MEFSIIALALRTLAMVKHRKKTLGITTLSKTTLSKITLSIMMEQKTLQQNNFFAECHNLDHFAECGYAEFHYANCH